MSDKKPKGGGFWWLKLLYSVNDTPHYVVMRVGGGAPSVAYESYERPKKEAERLANKQPANRFIIYRAVACFEIETAIKETIYMKRSYE